SAKTVYAFNVLLVWYSLDLWPLRYLPPFSLFFLLILPPPRSTLFPYTTLFRSVLQHCRHPDRRPFPWRRGAGCGRVGVFADDLLDRKSTRLNSSHVSISYAVFCLKKKKRPNCIVTKQAFREPAISGLDTF